MQSAAHACAVVAQASEEDVELLWYRLGPKLAFARFMLTVLLVVLATDPTPSPVEQPHLIASLGLAGSSLSWGGLAVVVHAIPWVDVEFDLGLLSASARVGPRFVIFDSRGADHMSVGRLEPALSLASLGKRSGSRPMKA